MAWVTEEEYQAAKQVRAYEYLQTYQPGRLKKTRTRNEWQLQDHDSFKINEIYQQMALEVQGYWWNVGSPVFDAGRWHGIYGSSKNLV